MTAQDPYHLERFISAQNPVYKQVIAELRAGKKHSHWMWFIFPQIDGLGCSATARFYSIKSAAEAREYLAHPILGERLRECARLLDAIKDKSATEIFGYPDDLKLRSSLTLFTVAGGDDPVFTKLLDRYFSGEGDPQTIGKLKQQADGKTSAH
jgi:uncharacterized protein (DUF1810 family)